jgi:hypothetical protein
MGRCSKLVVSQNLLKRNAGWEEQPRSERRTPGGNLVRENARQHSREDSHKKQPEPSHHRHANSFSGRSISRNAERAFRMPTPVT